MGCLLCVGVGGVCILHGMFILKIDLFVFGWWLCYYVVRAMLLLWLYMVAILVGVGGCYIVIIYPY